MYLIEYKKFKVDIYTLTFYLIKQFVEKGSYILYVCVLKDYQDHF